MRKSIYRETPFKFKEIFKTKFMDVQKVSLSKETTRDNFDVFKEQNKDIPFILDHWKVYNCESDIQLYKEY